MVYLLLTHTLEKNTKYVGIILKILAIVTIIISYSSLSLSPRMFPINLHVA